MTKPTRSEISRYYMRYGPLVYRRAMVLLGNVADAEDATQEVFVRALANIDAYGGHALTSWLYRITTNYCLNILRTKKTRQRILEEHYKARVSVFHGDPPLNDLLFVRCLLAVADKRQANAAVYVFVDGMTHSEAARELQVSERTVSNLIQRFRRWARDFMHSDEEDCPHGESEQFSVMHGGPR